MATIKGNSGNNNLIGTSGNDLLIGYGGDDTLNGGAGIDNLDGGEGNDTYIVDSTTDKIIESSGGGAHDLVKSSDNYTLGTYLNDLTLTGTKAINGTGNDFDNIITGNDANNILDGKGGIDTLIGGRGNDTYIVNSTTDVILEYSGGGAHDLVKSSVSYTLGNFLNDLTLTGTSTINGTGNEVDNIITGNSANNILQGGEGNDTLYGVGGNDYLTGGNFGDGSRAYLDGGTGHDTLQGELAEMHGGDGNDTLSGFSNTMYGDNGNDELTADASYLYGGAGNDTLNGDESNLYGGDGNDVLTGRASMIGGNGNDTLNGGGGDDYSIFNAPNAGVDTIVNFTSSDGDQIVVSASGFGGGLTAGATIAPAQFHIGTAAGDGTDRFIYNTNTGNLFFDVDGLNGTGQVLFATLVGAPAITNNNIVVF